LLVSINSFGPFQSEVWGTVSDWVIAVVTSLTGLAIWLTFKEQLSVTRTQKNLLDIELIKLREQFRTEILLTGGNTWTDVNTIWINLTAINHEAFNVRIINQPESDFKHEFVNSQFDILRISDWKTIIENNVAHEDLEGKYHILVLFEDASRNRYRQTISGSFLNPEISSPTLLGITKTETKK